MIARGGEEVSGLLLGGWGFPEQAGDGVRMRRLGHLVELEAVFGGARRVYLWRRVNDLAVEDLDLDGGVRRAMGRASQRRAGTYEVVTVLEVAANGKLAGAVALGPPLAPVEGIYGPGSQVVAGPRLGVDQVVAHRPGGAVRHARVGAWPDVGEAKRRVGEVALGARGIVFGAVAGGHELRGGAARRGGRVGMVGGRRRRVVGGGGGAGA